MVILLCPYIVFCVFPWFWIHLIQGHWLHWVEILYLWSVLGSCLLTDIITDFSNFGKATNISLRPQSPGKTLNDHFIKYMQLFLYIAMQLLYISMQLYLFSWKIWDTVAKWVIKLKYGRIKIWHKKDSLKHSIVKKHMWICELATWIECKLESYSFWVKLHV